MTKQKSDRLEAWYYRREFLEAAQRRVPAIGRYLRRYGMRAHDNAVRTQVIQAWQAHFNLNYSWAFESAWATLAMWDRFRADAEQSLQWYAAPPARNLGEVGLPRFEFQIERHFSRDLDFGWFKQSVHGVLEAELERFGAAIGAKDLGNRRRPMELRRAFECLALRVCKGLKPEQIRSRPEFSRDWTTLWKDLKSAAELVGIRPPRRGRPSKKSAR